MKEIRRLRRWDLASFGELLTFAASIQAKGQLIVQESVGVPEGVIDAIDWLITNANAYSSRVGEWPGTKLIGSCAEAYRFDLTPQCVSWMLKHSASPLDWEQPVLPEDLALLRPDKSVLLGTTAHERDCWLSLTRQELAQISSDYQSLMKVIHRPR